MKVSKIKVGENPERNQVSGGVNLKNGIKKAVDGIGGFGKFIKPGDVVLLKPNLILASESRADIDIEGVKIIQGFEGNSLKGAGPMEITHIRMAKEFGM